jgi:hypothetical protein
MGQMAAEGGGERSCFVTEALLDRQRPTRSSALLLIAEKKWRPM